MLICNEEPAKRTQQRAVMSYSGLDKDKVFLSKKYAKEMWNKIKDQTIIRDATDKAFPTLTLTTLAGSIIPAEKGSTNS